MLPPLEICDGSLLGDVFVWVIQSPVRKKPATILTSGGGTWGLFLLESLENVDIICVSGSKQVISCLFPASHGFQGTHVR